MVGGTRRPTGRGGFAVVYFLCIWTALIGFCSLAIDYGRVQMVRSQLQCTADAAARAGLLNLPSGVAAAQNAAVAVAAANTVDGSAVTVSAAADVVFGSWNPVTQTMTVLTGTQQASANAVQVTTHRTAGGGNAVPLLFAGVVGRAGCDAHATSIACKPTNIALVNGDFEQPALGGGNYQYDVSMPGWTLTGSACLETNGSAWGGPNANGNQAVSLQGTPGGALAAITQSFPVVAGRYAVSFIAAQRTSWYQGPSPCQPIQVSIDGLQVAIISPTSGSFQACSTPAFTLTTGTHTLQMAATDNSYDHTSFVDTVAVNVVSGGLLLAK